MNGRTRTRLHPGAPWGLVGMMVLVGAIERFEVRDNLDFTGNVAASWRFTGRKIKHGARRSNVLIFGDSLVKFGVMPPVINRRTGQRSYNAAIHSGPAPSSYFLFRRALDAGAKPAAVVVNYTWVCLADGPASPSRPYPWADLLTFDESFELCSATRDPILFARIMTGQILASFRGRFEIRASILAALRGKSTGQRDVTRWLIRNWTVNAGGQGNWKNPDFKDVPAHHSGTPLAATWRFDPVNVLYVRKFLALAACRGITVYCLLPPISPGTQAKWEHQGDDALLCRFIRNMQEQFPNLIVIDGRHAGYEPSVFVDSIHLDYEGAIALSAGLAEVLRRPQTGARWVALPRFRHQQIDAPVEHIAESRRIVQALDAAMLR